MILTVAILLAGAGTGYAQSQDANSRKMARKQMKAEQDARDRLAFEEARKAIEAKEFVLEADQVSFKSGSTAQVSSNTNFVAVQGDKAVVGYDKGRIELDGSNVAVQDSGPGVPDYALPRLGERFFTTARPGGERSGSGLGLAIVRRVMALHGGHMAVRNTQPGLRVVLEFPAG